MKCCINLFICSILFLALGCAQSTDDITKDDLIGVWVPTKETMNHYRIRLKSKFFTNFNEHKIILKDDGSCVFKTFMTSHKLTDDIKEYESYYGCRIEQKNEEWWVIMFSGEKVGPFSNKHQCIKTLDKRSNYKSWKYIIDYPRYDYKCNVVYFKYEKNPLTNSDSLAPSTLPWEIRYIKGKLSIVPSYPYSPDVIFVKANSQIEKNSL
ncbi:MAG: hypothetical protein HQL32_08215 [Planctomycetes bacterium]|nr:hypothetical protein [Planctomycetota bacterium]